MHAWSSFCGLQRTILVGCLLGCLFLLSAGPCPASQTGLLPTPYSFEVKETHESFPSAYMADQENAGFQIS